MTKRWLPKRVDALIRRVWYVAGLSIGLTHDLPAQTNPANRDTVLAPGPQYQAGWLHRFVFGGAYRPLWSAPLRVPYLDLDTLGGLVPVRRGGGAATRTLHLAAGDGRQFVFRSVDKDPDFPQGLPGELRGTFVESVVRDQISAYHPYAALVVPPLLDAVGVLHVDPVLRVAPDSERLGEFREEFAGLIGLFEERPDDTTGLARRVGAETVVGSDRMMEWISENPRHRVDAPAYLTARLMDMFLGDRDRWAGNWRWARFNTPEGRRWRPIPRDRDQAFIRMEGAALKILGFYEPRILSFGPRLKRVTGLTRNGWDLDRRFLSELPRASWDSIVGVVMRAMSDSIIDAAVSRLPGSAFAASGDELAALLRERRGDLPRAADRLFALVNRDAEVHATEDRDLARLEARGDALTVRLFPRERNEATPSGPAYFERTFVPSETREIRVYLGGDDDRAVVTGPDPGIRIRIVGGQGADVLTDSSRAAVHLYDGGGRTVFTEGASTDIDRSDYVVPPSNQSTYQDPPDFGTHTVPNPWLWFRSDVGLVIGGGVVRHYFGFRRYPFASSVAFRGAIATGDDALNAEIEFRGQVRPSTFLVLGARTSGVEQVRFHGFGNATTIAAPSDFYRIHQRQSRVDIGLTWTRSHRLTVSAGGVVKVARTSPQDAEGTILDAAVRIYGSGTFSQTGIQGEIRIDTRERPHGTASGWVLTGGASVFPALADVTQTFGGIEGSASRYVTVGPLTLAGRAGGRRIWGRVPFHEAAYLGGNRTLRGYGDQRFAGDASLFGNVETRLALGRIRFVVPTRVGLVGLGDAGRVFLDGNSPGGWHTAVGGGVWLSPIRRIYVIQVVVARSAERTTVSAGAGFTF